MTIKLKIRLNILNNVFKSVSHIFHLEVQPSFGVRIVFWERLKFLSETMSDIHITGAPKKANIDGNPPSVNVANGPGVLTVNMTAYPTPQIKLLTYLGTNDSSDGQQVKENSVYAACSTTLLSPASVTCNVIVINMTHNDEGFYRIVFSNSLGDLPFTFFVKGNCRQENNF